MPSGTCGPSRIRSGEILYWMPALIMASPLPRRNGKGLRASLTFCRTDCGGLTIQNDEHGAVRIRGPQRSAQKTTTEHCKFILCINGRSACYRHQSGAVEYSA